MSAELLMLIVCNGAILGFLLAGFIGELSPNAHQQETEKRKRR